MIWLIILLCWSASAFYDYKSFDTQLSLGEQALIQNYFRYGVIPDEYDTTSALLLLASVFYDSKDDLLIRVHSGEAVNAFNGLPLLIAIYEHHEEIVDVLLKEGADASLRSNKAVILSVESYNHKATDRLTCEYDGKRHADADMNEGMLVDLAIDYGHLENLEALLKCGAIARSRSLLLAVTFDDADIIDLLMGKGADIDETLLLAIQERKPINLIKKLLDHGATASSAALNVAISVKYQQAAMVLLNKGAMVTDEAIELAKNNLPSIYRLVSVKQ